MLILILFLNFVKLYLVLKWICEIFKYIDDNNVFNKRKGITVCRSQYHVQYTLFPKCNA